MSGVLATLFAAIALVAAAFSVTRPSAARALTWLLATLLALAGTFFALTATFAGALQILVYAGAVVAVFVFVLVTVDASPQSLALERRRMRAGWPVPTLVAVLLLVPFVIGPSPPPAPAGDSPEVTAQDVGELLFGPWAIAVEVASFLLLASLIGVRHLGRLFPDEGASSAEDQRNEPVDGDDDAIGDGSSDAAGEGPAAPGGGR